MDSQDVEAVYPLSPIQQGILFHSVLARDTDPYVGQIGITLTGRLDLPAFERSWQAVVDRHPILRTVFTSERRGRALQVVLKSVPIELRHSDWRHLDTAAQQRQMERLLAEDRARGVDPALGPLMRLALIQLTEQTHRLVWTEHHLILDGWSVPLVLDDLAVIYAAECRGERASLAPAPGYRTYIEWLANQDREAAETYWRALLAGERGRTALALERPAEIRAAGARGVQVAHLEAECLSRLRAVAKANRVTLNSVVHGAWAILVSRYSGQTDIVYGATTSGRPADLNGVASIVGPFINTLPVRARIDPAQRVGDLFRTLQAQQAESRRFEYTPLVDIQQWAGVTRGDALIESLFVFENYPERRTPDAAAEGLAMSGISASEQSSFPLALLAGVSDRLVIKALYDAGLFDDAAVAALVAHLRTLLERIAVRPDARIADLEMLGEAERSRVLVDWNRTMTAYPAQASIPDLFEEQARLHPKAIAIECDGQTMTYAALDAQANRLAWMLRAKGIGSEQLVGVGLERGPKMIVALLAIMKAGGAYLPLDPNNPRARTDYILAESGAAIVVREERTGALFEGAEIESLCLDRDAAALALCPVDRPARDLSPRQLAYVMYTSGSTGEPKGVGIEHRSVVRLVRKTNFIRFSSSDVVLQFAPLAFDASTFEIWGCLLNGARLVIVPAHLPSLVELAEVIARAGVSTLWLTGGLFHRMVDAHAPALRGVRQLIAGGEALSVKAVRKALAELPRTRLVNGYGPTENCTFTTCHAITAGEADGESIAIGRPIANTQAYILDPDLGLTAPGLPGELYAAGDGLARGYHHRPDLTAERFIPNPYGGEPGARLYRTGDRARYRPDGAIEFLGRLDGQVKVRGFRIELEEIEAVLDRHPSVRQSATAIRETESHDAQIVAAVVLHQVDRDTLDSIRAFAAAQLPAYMVPTRLIPCERLPLTPNGKVDRRAIAASAGDIPVAAPARATTSSPVEEVLTDLWRDLFQVALVGPADDFFALGGHSLLAMQAISRLRDLFPVNLPLRAIFEHPTVAALAREIERLARVGEHEREPMRRVSRLGDLPLSLAQQRLWFLDRFAPGNPFYNIHLAFRLRGPLDIAALERSLDEMGRRHEALRTTFPDRDGEPVQRIAPEPEIALRFITGVEDDEALREIVNREAHRPFSLAEGPLLRPVVIRRGDDDHVLLLVMHHIIADGHSVRLLLEELSRRYGAHAGGEACALPDYGIDGAIDGAIQYVDFAVWERQWLDGPDVARLTAYWQERLKDAPRPMPLAGARPRPARRSFRGETYSWSIASPVRAQVESLSRRQGVTRFMVMLAALYVLLRHHTGQDDLIVGADVANRSQPETQSIVGFFVNQVALRIDLSGNPSFRTLLARVRDVALGAYAHDELPFQKVLDAVGAERHLNQTALFQTKLLYQQGGAADMELAGLDAAPFRVELDSSAFDLVLAVLETPGGLLATFEFDTDLFERAAIVRLSEDLDVVLAHAVAHADTTVIDLSARLTERASQRLAGGAAPDHLRLPQERPSASPFTPAVLHEVISDDIAGAWSALSHDEVRDVALACWQTLLWRLSRQPDVTVAIPIDGREHDELRGDVGFSTQYVPIRSAMSSAMPFRELLSRVSAATREAGGALTETATFPYQFVSHDLRVVVTRQEVCHEPLKLRLEVSRGADGWAMTLAYDASRFAAEDVALLAEQYLTLLAAAVRMPERTVGALPINSARHLTRLRATREAPACAPAADLIDTFERQVAATPEALAVICGPARITYAALDARANQLAADLRARGVAPDTRVALCFERSPEMLVAIIAVLKADGAYVPLDPTYPAERLRWMLDETAAPIVLTHAAVAARLPPTSITIVDLDRDAARLAALDPASRPRRARPDDAAYVIYTSGSTGRPKGVVITRDNVARLFRETERWYRFGPDDVWSMCHNYAFDVSVWEMWGAWLHGGRLVVASRLETRAPDQLHALLAREQVTILSQTPSAFRQLAPEVTRDEGPALSVRAVVFAGEPLDPGMVRGWLARYPDSAVVNMYGITETTVHSTYKRLDAADARQPERSPIGVAFADLRTYLLLEDGAEAGFWETGELYLAGAGLARGYLRRPELTAERFLPEIEAATPGARMYRSGDLARRRPDGALEYVGRRDHQVKIRGYRVEPGEIESALRQQPGVREAAVLLKGEGADQRLAAYVFRAAGHTLDVETLRAALQGTLPDYMVPPIFVLLDTLPLTPNGKLDTRALPEPDHQRPALQQTYVAPRTEQERILADVWAEVLGLEMAGVHDNYFVLGGDSIRSVRIVARAKARGLSISVQAVFQHQTIAELAREAASVEPNTPHVFDTSPFSLIAPEDRARLPEGIEDAYPITMLQGGMLYHLELEPTGSIYHNVVSFNIEAGFALDLFQQAVDLVVGRHAILRTSFDLVSYSAPLQLVHAAAALPVTLIDIRDVPADEQRPVIARHVEQERQRRFDMSMPPLLRIQIHRTTDDRFNLTITDCHAILDGWSLTSTIAEIFTYYFALCAHETPVLEPAMAVTYRDFVHLEQQAMVSPAFRAFWRLKLEGCTPTVVTRWPFEAVDGAHNPVMRFTLDAPLLARLNVLAQRLGVSLKATLLAAHMKVLSLLTGQDDVVTGLSCHGRPEVLDGDRLRGNFLNTIPYRLAIAPGSWEDLIRRTFDAELEGLPFQRYPFAQLQRTWGRKVVVDTLFAVLNFHSLDQMAKSGKMKFMSHGNIETAETNFSLSAICWISPFPEQLPSTLFLQFTREMGLAQIEAIGRCYLSVLDAIATEPGSSHADTHRFDAFADRERDLLRTPTGVAELDGSFTF
jgi:amino acid adenylation domain-containing protein